MTKDTRASLTPAMKGVLIAVGALVIAALVATIWLLSTAPTGEPDTAEPAALATPTTGPIPGATPTSGSEVLPPPDADANRLPAPTPSQPLITAPLPTSASGERTLVDGFPAAIMGPATDADVVQNAIATEGTTMQVSLVARTDATREEVSGHYEALWGSLGLTPQTVGLSGALTYTGPFESLSLAFTAASGTGTVYMIHGVFRTS